MAGSNEMPTELEGIAPPEKRLSVTVGMVEPESGERVNNVRPTGPILAGETLVQYLRCCGTDSEECILTRGYRRHH